MTPLFHTQKKRLKIMTSLSTKFTSDNKVNQKATPFFYRDQEMSFSDCFFILLLFQLEYA